MHKLRAGVVGDTRPLRGMVRQPRPDSLPRWLCHARRISPQEWRSTLSNLDGLRTRYSALLSLAGIGIVARWDLVKIQRVTGIKKPAAMGRSAGA